MAAATAIMIAQKIAGGGGGYTGPKLTATKGYGNWTTPGGNSGTAVTNSFTSVPGKAVLILCGGEGTPSVSLSDSYGGNTYTQIGSQYADSQWGTTVWLSCYICNLTNGGSGHTFTLGALASFPTIVVIQLDMAVNIDVVGTGAETVPPPYVNTVTPSAADTLVCGVVLPAVAAANWTLASSGFTQYITGSEADPNDWDVGLLYKEASAQSGVAQGMSISGTNLDSSQPGLVYPFTLKP